MRTSNFETKKKIVEAGNSKIFENWKTYANIRKEDFLQELEWLCADPCDGSTGGAVGQLTRELGCDPKRGLVRLVRHHDNCIGFRNVSFWENGDKKMWNKQGCASISAHDRV